MIVVHDPPEFRIITQPDHAHLSGTLLSLWMKDGLLDHPRREDLLFAAREHDNGWREADAAPRYDAIRQRPYDFSSFPSTERLEIWQRGIGRFSRERPYVALLIAHHAQSLYRQAAAVPDGWHQYQSSLDESQQDWFDRAATDPLELEQDYRFLQTADLLSLAACDRWEEPLDTSLVRAFVIESTLQLSPFPLAGSTTVQVPCRRIPDRSYLGDADLGGELATARWSELAIRIAPGPATP